MYPRELNLDSETEEALKVYLDEQLLNHYGERSPWMTRLLQWQRDYWAEPTKTRATHPFVGASTIVIPLTAIAVEAVHARTMTTLFALGQLVSTTAISADWSDAARPVEQFMNRELMGEMQARKKLGSAILELEKFGTGIGKVGYERVVRIACKTREDGTEEEIPVTIRNGAVIDSVANGRFLMPLSAQDPQTSPWCGEEHNDTPYNMASMEDSGLFRRGTMDKLGGWVSQMSRSTLGVERQYQASQENLEHRSPSWPGLLDWVEIWLGFNTDKNPAGEHKEIVVHYHRGARLIMSCRYNWHDDLHRPYRVGNYFPVEHRWMGIGICKQNEQFQRSVTTQHRQRLDNGTLANMRMIKISKLSGYGPGEPIFPGKMWFLNDMDHVDTLQLGELYNSAFNNEQATLQYHEKRVGVNDTVLGAPAAGTPGTATGDLARIQESNKRFDFVYANIKEFARELIIDTAVMIQQFGPRRIEYLTTSEHGDQVAAFFQMPAEFIRHGLLIEIGAAGQQQNKVLDRQNWISIATLLQQYYTGASALAGTYAQISSDPSLLQMVTLKGLVASTEAMRQILESFDLRNVDRMVLGEISAMLEKQFGPAVNGGPNPRTQLLAAQPDVGGPGAGGMDNLSRVVRLISAGQP